MLNKTRWCPLGISSFLPPLPTTTSMTTPTYHCFPGEIKVSLRFPRRSTFQLPAEDVPIFAFKGCRSKNRRSITRSQNSSAFSPDRAGQVSSSIRIRPSRTLTSSSCPTFLRTMTPSRMILIIPDPRTTEFDNSSPSFLLSFPPFPCVAGRPHIFIFIPFDFNLQVYMLPAFFSLFFFPFSWVAPFPRLDCDRGRS